VLVLLVLVLVLPSWCWCCRAVCFLSLPEMAFLQGVL
jgi:hypothetical protein